MISRYELLFRGVDATQLSHLPIEGYGPVGFKSSLIKLTCAQNKQWTSPENISYQIADQISEVEEVPAGVQDSYKRRTYNTHHDFRAQLLQNSALERQNGLFANNTEYQKQMNNILNKSQTAAEVSASFSVLRVSLQNESILEMKPEVNAEVLDLPNRFEDSPEDYFDFISKHGTHFCSVGEFGGTVKQVSSTEVSFYRTNSVENAAEGKFNYTLNSLGVKVDNFTFGEDFVAQSSVITSYYGGNEFLLTTTGNAQLWYPTITPQPWLLNCKLVPISRIIKHNGKQTSMDLAVQAYLNKAYLAEAVETLNGLLNDYPEDKSQITDLIVQANDLKSTAVPVHASVTELSSRVSPGNWWQNVRLCFRSTDCANNGNPLCAEPNAFTSVYTDINQFAVRECSMSWGIMSPPNDHDEWFSSVEICFRYSAALEYRSPNYQRACEPDPTIECVSVNRYMNDIIDRKNRWCLSWMLKVPSTSPPWMLRSKLCLRHKSQFTFCSSLADRKINGVLCAFANEWTAEYMDYPVTTTNNCEMQWGIFEQLEHEPRQE